jgi:uncharacterized damage-inducible protein DinB
MATTANPTPATVPAMPSPKDQFLNAFEMETATTLRVLQAYPKDKADLKPAPKCKSAIALSWMFVGEMGMILTALTTGFDWSNPPKMPPVPDSMDAVIATFKQLRDQVATMVSGMNDAQFAETVQFPSGPGKMGTPTKIEFLWFVLCDQIHHRGQLSIYLRMADGKLPSIYGPTADEPWM